MQKNDSSKTYILLVFVFTCVLAIIYIPKFLKRDEGISDVKSILKDKYGVNEVVPVYIDDEQMSRKYLQDYINNLIYDMRDSYNLLNEDYRDDRFGSVDNYISYIDSLGIRVDASVLKYYIFETNGYKVYDVFDTDGHRYIFKTKGVMQYEVYFDSIEVEEDE